MTADKDPEKHPSDSTETVDTWPNARSEHHGSDARSLTVGEESPRSSSVASSARQHDSEKDIEKGQLGGEIADDTAGPSGELSNDAANEAVQASSGDVDLKNLPPPVYKDRKDRRGMLAQLCIVDEAEEPKHYPRRIKWSITALVGFAAIAAPIGSNILLPSLGQISQTFHSPQNVTNLSISLYVAGIGILPIFWSSFSEVWGRRSVLVFSFGILTLFNILSAVSTNVGMFVAMRILSGGASASVQAVGGGVIADVWHVKERGTAMSTYYLGPLMGPLCAPIIGGALQQGLGWRSTMWFNTIYGVITFVLLLTCLPETIARRRGFGAKATPPPPPIDNDGRTALTRVASRQSLKNNSKLIGRVLNGLFIQPCAIVLYLQFPAVVITMYYASITFGSLYMLQISIEDVFANPPYQFSTIEIGLTYIPSSLGYATSSVLAGKWTDYIMAREARKAGRYDANGKLVYRPEDRMKENVWTAAMVYPLALLWWGWSAQKGVFWLVPCIANFFFGVGSMIVFATVTTMLTEFMPNKAASAIALNNFLRMATAAIGIGIAQPLLDAIGTGWTFTAICIIAICSSSIIWVMKRYGPRWRETMDKRIEEKGL